MTSNPPTIPSTIVVRVSLRVRVSKREIRCQVIVNKCGWVNFVWLHIKVEFLVSYIVFYMVTVLVTTLKSTCKVHDKNDSCRICTSTCVYISAELIWLTSLCKDRHPSLLPSTLLSHSLFLSSPPFFLFPFVFLIFSSLVSCTFLFFLPTSTCPACLYVALATAL